MHRRAHASHDGAQQNGWLRRAVGARKAGGNLLWARLPSSEQCSRANLLERYLLEALVQLPAQHG